MAVPALAGFSGTASATQTATSGALAAPTGLTAAGGCQVLVLGPKIELAWTASASTFATGYDILRATSSAGPYSLRASVNGRATTTYTDTSVGTSSTYHYVVRASRNLWRSPDSNRASATTPTLCL
jgi:hypothetical protein